LIGGIFDAESRVVKKPSGIEVMITMKNRETVIPSPCDSIFSVLRNCVRVIMTTPNYIFIVNFIL
jgi:hypothetical protein